MAVFEYEALTGESRLMRGTVEAGSQEEARATLTEMGLSVSSVSKAPKSRPSRGLGRSEFMLFNQQLASITKAGIPLERSLRELSSDISSRRMRKLVDEIASELEQGTSIERAFEKRQKNFPELYGRILKAGVESGRLSEMLMSLNRHLEMSSQTRRIVFEATCYPAVVLSLAAVLMTGVLVLIAPHFRAIFEDFGTRLPAITEAMLALSDLVAPLWLGVGCLVAVVLIIRAAMSRYSAGRRYREAIVMRVPVLGRLYRSSMLSRLSDSMAVLVNAGCDMPKCLRLGAVATGSETLKLECELLADHVERGGNLVEGGQLCSMLPGLFLYSIQLGSQRNELQNNLYSLADMYSQQAQYRQARLQTVLLPLMIIAVGFFMAVFVLGMFMPMVSLVSSFGG